MRHVTDRKSSCHVNLNVVVYIRILKTFILIVRFFYSRNDVLTSKFDRVETLSGPNQPKNNVKAGHKTERYSNKLTSSFDHSITCDRIMMTNETFFRDD